MLRLAVLMTSGAVLAGCSGYSIPGLDSLRGAAATASVRVESSPAGAEAQVSGGVAGGASCRTPCTLEIPATGTTNITFSLQGYLPQMVPVSVFAAAEGADLPDTGVASQLRTDPNPVFAQLELAPPPPPPARRKPAPRKPRPAPAAAAPPPPPPPPPTQGFGPPQQPGFGPPQQPGFGPPQQPVYR
jgi:hypothetical protein